jgi:hypothetical protein
MLKWLSYKFLVLLSGLIFLSMILTNPRQSGADVIQNRSIKVQSAVASDVTTHSFQLTLPTTNNVGSIVFEYCSNSPLVYFSCTAPTGFDINSAVLASQSGNVGFSLDNADTTNNKIVLTRPVAPGLTVPSGYVFNNVTNPSTPGQTVFIRIATYASTDGSGSQIDLGAVAFSVTSQFEIGAYVPPFLKLCVGITVSPDCTSQIGDSLDLGVLSSNAVRSGQSQFSTATNDPNGYVIFALGTTMTSGNNTIPSLNNLAASFPGTGQFGINLRANLIPAVGQDPIGIGTGSPTPNYNVPNHYIFNSGDSITTSNLPSDYNRMTVSYITNVPSKQPPGIYSTTVTYVAVVQF